MRLGPGTRSALRAVSVVLLVAGLGLFLAAVFAMFSGFAGGPEDGLRDDPFAPMRNFVLLLFAGVFCVGAGGALARIAFLKPVAEVFATETEGALRTAAGAVGEGLAAGGLGHGVKVRCRSCRALDSEDARFCSSCGEPM